MLVEFPLETAQVYFMNEFCRICHPEWAYGNYVESVLVWEMQYVWSFLKIALKKYKRFQLHPKLLK